MAYLDDKIEQSDLQAKKNDDTVARASLEQLSRRWGVVGGIYWMIEKKAPPEIRIKSMAEEEEVWTLEPGQTGPFKEKMYRKTK